MCNFEGRDIETLNTHTFTSEMYQCNDMIEKLYISDQEKIKFYEWKWESINTRCI